MSYFVKTTQKPAETFIKLVPWPPTAANPTKHFSYLRNILLRQTRKLASKCDATNAGMILESSFFEAQKRLYQEARSILPCNKAKRLVPSATKNPKQKIETSRHLKFYSQNKLPALQLDLLSSQQVDIENYNVSASRLLTPTIKMLQKKGKL